MGQTTQEKIRDQNDLFRGGDDSIPGQVVITRGLNDLTEGNPRKMAELARVVQDFNDFTPDNDPYGTHDFGIFDFEGHRCNWKIDLYDKNYEYGSEEPSDLSKTNRVLTILLASEY